MIPFQSVLEAPGSGTPGYWKSHPDAWPVDEIIIPAPTYTKGETSDMLRMPEKGDKTWPLSRGLIAAKLNVTRGNCSSCVADSIDATDTWMAAHGPASRGLKANSGA